MLYYTHAVLRPFYPSTCRSYPLSHVSELLLDIIWLVPPILLSIPDTFPKLTGQSPFGILLMVFWNLGTLLLWNILMLLCSYHSSKEWCLDRSKVLLIADWFLWHSWNDDERQRISLVLKLCFQVPTMHCNDFSRLSMHLGSTFCHSRSPR